MDGSERRIRVHARPVEVRVAGDDLDRISRRVLAEELAAAERRGVAEGRRQLSEEARSAVRALDKAASELEAAHERAERELEAKKRELGEFAVRLAVEIARHLLRAEIDAGRYDLDRIVRETLAESGVGRGNCVVHLAPEDHAALEGARFRGGTVLEQDPSVPRGDVHVTTPDGIFVRDLDAALRRLADRLRGEAR